MDPQFHDESEIHPNSPRAPWARRVPDGVPRPGPYDPPPPRPSLVPLVVLAVVLILLLTALSVIGIILVHLGHTLRDVLGNDGIAIVFYGFTLIALLGCIRLLKQRGG